MSFIYIEKHSVMFGGGIVSGELSVKIVLSWLNRLKSLLGFIFLTHGERPTLTYYLLSRI